MQDDGSPPPFGTVIELDCGDTITREATVDSTGGYGFQVGSRNRIGRVMPDASDRIGEDIFETADVSQNMGLRERPTLARTTPLSVRLLRCEVRGQYPGYRSTSARMKAGSIWGYTEVAPILMYPITRVRGTSVSLTSLLAPKQARRSVERATKALKKATIQRSGSAAEISDRHIPYKRGSLVPAGGRCTNCRSAIRKRGKAIGRRCRRTVFMCVRICVLLGFH